MQVDDGARPVVGVIGNVGHDVTVGVRAAPPVADEATDVARARPRRNHDRIAVHVTTVGDHPTRRPFVDHVEHLDSALRRGGAVAGGRGGDRRFGRCLRKGRDEREGCERAGPHSVEPDRGHGRGADPGLALSHLQTGGKNAIGHPRG